MNQRGRVQEDARSCAFDVCVIGGGASGAGCALDAQLRGLSTVLIEARDFASETSSASTKMVHGGIRYLQSAVKQADYKQYRLVSHALRERAFMIANAPHLAHPLRFVVPCSSRTEQLYYGIGLKMYDWIAGSHRLAKSELVTRDEALKAVPELTGRNLAGGVCYTDGQFDDAGYGLALVRTFVENGGRALNYVRASGFAKDARGRIESVAVVDQFTNTTFHIRARIVVNATGPFSDDVRLMANSRATARMRPSKGVHVLLPLRQEWKAGMVVPETDDGRVIFAIPYRGRLLVGTTDEAATPSDEMVVTRREVEFLLAQLNRYMDIPFMPDDVVSGFAGLRPLVRSGESAETKQLIRDDELVVDHQSGLVSILGGKWTTYRLMAEKTIDRVQQELGLPVGGCVTRDHRLIGSGRVDTEAWRSLVARSGIGETTADHLIGKLGTEAVEVVRLVDADPALARTLVDGAPPIRAEVVHAVRTGMAATVEDVIARRIGLELYDWRLAAQAAPCVAALMGRELGWSAAEQSMAADSYEGKIAHLLESAGLTPSRLSARGPLPRQ